MHLHRRPDHSTEELCNIRGVTGMLERHHGFCTRAIPSGGQIFFEEHHSNISVLCDIGRLLVTHFESVDSQRRRCATEGMYHLSAFQLKTSPFLYLCNTVVQISVCQCIAGTVKHLNNQNRIYISIMLLKAILSPVFPFFLPVVRSRLQNSHIVVNGSLFRVGYNDSIL